MIIIKIIVLYFIQIRHTDDFPSNGTRLVNCKSLIGCNRMLDLNMSTNTSFYISSRCMHEWNCCITLDVVATDEDLYDLVRTS